MNLRNLLQTFIAVSLTPELHFQVPVPMRPPGPFFYAYPIIDRLITCPGFTSAVHSLSSSPNRAASSNFVQSDDGSAIRPVPNPVNPGSHADAAAKSRRFLKGSSVGDKKTAAVSVTNLPLRTILDQPAEVTSNQLKDSIAAIDSALQGLTSKLQDQRRCPITELYSLQFYCGVLGGNCYCLRWFGAFEMTFDEAERYCKGIGLDGLASIETSEQQFLLFKTFGLLTPSDGLWTSGTDAKSLGNFVWKTTGRAFTYRNWAGGEPAVLSEPGCVKLTATGKWVAVPCSAGTASFICELRNASNVSPVRG